MPKNIKEIKEGDLRDKIYTIRGQKVMLDRDLAELYGYTTKAFNQQVRNNLEKFKGEDFMFRLNKDELSLEVRENLRSNFLTSSWGGTRYAPYAFTEQGVYMLMTILKGELATRQSRALIITFKQMKDYILESQEAIAYKESLGLALKVTENAQQISQIKNEVKRLESKINNIDQELDTTITKSEITKVIQGLSKTIEQRECVLMDGKPMSASEVYINIYKSAKESIYIIDNYIDIRTLRHLQKVKPNTEIIIFSDNLGNFLHQNDYQNFQKEYSNLAIKFIKTNGKIHDRFIILDYDTKNEIIYHSGASEKDAGGRMSAITKFREDDLKEKFKEIIKKLKQNPELILK